MDATRDALQLAHGDLTREIIGAFHDVYNDLGHGYVESVYVRSLMVALGDRGISYEREAPLIVRFRGTIVGTFRVDLLVERTIIVEMKTGEKIVPVHERQLLNYLRASRLSVGLVLNVGERPSVRRMIWTSQPGRQPSTETPTERSTERSTETPTETPTERSTETR